MDYYDKADEYSDMMYSVIDEHPELAWIRESVAICCLKSNKEKKSSGMLTLGECIKVSDVYRSFCPYDFPIVIYEANCAGMTDDQMRILMHHELLHVDVNEKNGEPVYRVAPHDIQDFRTIIDSYGIDWAKTGG